MTFAQTMTRDELLEFAALDAFALLDEYDADRYTRAFNEAPEAVQDEVRRVQAELTIDPSLLTIDAEPPFALRERVLAAVAAAIEREEAQLAPLASIGRGHRSDVESDQRRTWFASSGMFWRAACFVLAAGCLVMGYQWSAAVQEANVIAKLALTNLTDTQLKQLIGPDFDTFVKNNKGDALALRPTASDYPAQATVYRDEATGSAFVLATLLPAQADNAAYTIRVKPQSQSSAQSVFETVASFISNGTTVGLRIEELSTAMLASTSWEIVNAAGAVVLTSDPIGRA